MLEKLFLDYSLDFLKLVSEYQKKLNLSANEYSFVVLLLSEKKKKHTVLSFVKKTGLEKSVAENTLNSLHAKKIITFVYEENENGKVRELISLKPLYAQILDFIQNPELDPQECVLKEVAELIEKNAKPLSANQYILIKNWLESKKTTPSTLKEIIENIIKEGYFTFGKLEAVVQNYSVEGKPLDQKDKKILSQIFKQ